VARYFVGIQVLDISGPFFLENLSIRASARREDRVVQGLAFAVVIAFVELSPGTERAEGASAWGAHPRKPGHRSLSILIITFSSPSCLNMLFPYGA